MRRKSKIKRQKSKPRRKHKKVKPISYQMIKLGTGLQALRKEQGLSIREAAKRCNLTASYLSKIESGKFKSLSIDTLLLLSRLYKTPIEILLKEAEFFQNGEYDSNNLPSFQNYLRAKFAFSSTAISDMELAKEIIERKYQK